MGRMQIGEVAERTGLSLRTIRYYGEVGLVAPSGRTEGGFRLYTDGDVATLELIKTMKPLGYTLEEMSEVLEVLGALDRETAPGRRAELVEQLAVIRASAATRRDRLREQLAAAESFILRLDERAGDGG
ncbi:DNA-binding transcriptional regulator, MerR family [Georgenia satyanarayanai]|uniref:DNA-binding transcriptional regulator, MerR family n=2 Tax=Georgenia satyanarayanai TaxID=860221 RepID=A0A2Y9A7L9_9MICO|nr:MerR family transcriptional regulator [Georgenia satyanarayanai]PYG00209.1 DNA-binding transcriptional MerR regulator [Georgenia satyanarayanai]SSA40461.1 DNA-binding transcriptional regulator, MerR family [Georgenia satyanarayanai]